jgi:hypothetical protein
MDGTGTVGIGQDGFSVASSCASACGLLWVQVTQDVPLNRPASSVEVSHPSLSDPVEPPDVKLRSSPGNAPHPVDHRSAFSSAGSPTRLSTPLQMQVRNAEETGKDGRVSGSDIRGVSRGSSPAVAIVSASTSKLDEKLQAAGDIDARTSLGKTRGIDSNIDARQHIATEELTTNSPRIRRASAVFDGCHAGSEVSATEEKLVGDLEVVRGARAGLASDLEEPLCAWRKEVVPHPEQKGMQVVFYFNSDTQESTYEMPGEYRAWELKHALWRQGRS